MTELIIHQNTVEQINSLLKAPSHAVAIIAPSGSGKLSLARHIAEQILGIDDIQNYPYALELKPAKDTPYGINDVRQMQSHLSLKVLNHKDINRVVILEQAHELGLEAQNALLKTLEEPPRGTIILLTADNLQSLIPTIRSRLRVINIVKPDKQDLKKYFKTTSEEEFNRLYSLSGGRAGLLSALINSEDHPLREAASIAREIVSKSAYERMVMVDQLSKNKQTLTNVFTVLQQMAHVSLSQAGGKSVQRWKNILVESTKAIEALRNNAQTKLVLLKFMISI